MQIGGGGGEGDFFRGISISSAARGDRAAASHSQISRLPSPRAHTQRQCAPRCARQARRAYRRPPRLPVQPARCRGAGDERPAARPVPRERGLAPYLAPAGGQRGGEPISAARPPPRRELIAHHGSGREDAAASHERLWAQVVEVQGLSGQLGSELGRVQCPDYERRPCRCSWPGRR